MRRGLVALTVALTAVLLLVGCRSQQQNQVADAVNGDRIAHQLPALAPSDMLDLKAQAWADQLARDGYLHHSTLTAGISGCWVRIGENVGYGASIAGVEGQYMASPPHRANILNSAFNRVGVGYVRTADGRVWTVQEFAQLC